MKSFKKGFTIIELLIVMSIIFVLMGLLVPRFKGYRMKAENLKIENYARQIYTATMASYSEMDGKFVKENIEDNIINLINITGNKKKVVKTILM
ncbi:type II secretion system protein [Clostridium tetanomorphum]|uniref:type II secretion system protein n=1 Tax=Clostridium tetanomorphum TaxID=1553 RepID=UPI000D8778C7|nr:type II secretion system protein [Clostridium tetanomorphum]SQB91477.1 putative type IV pilin [Clostridium tetanomorphum]